MQIITRSEIEKALKTQPLMEAMKHAFIAYSSGQITCPPIGHLPFPENNGDLHIKYGHIQGDDVCVVKLSSGFYDNPTLGLPSSNGLMLILSARTGEPLALLQDEGYLTDARTAIAGALASKTLAPINAPYTIGIIGTGTQARLQLQYLNEILPISKVSVWGRNSEKARAYSDEMKQLGLSVNYEKDLQSLCSQSNILITTTPSQEVIIKADWIKQGTHITAVGADAPGKQELEESLFKKATFTLFDSKEQCLHHGECSHTDTVFTKENSAEIGEFFANPDIYKRSVNDITIADLTGIAAQDICIAKEVWKAVKTNLAHRF